MAFCVKELLRASEMAGVKVIGGEGGLDNQIKGVTIIEAPDIVKFIDGGEVLLTGLYAFKSCSLEEYREYLDALSKKKASALVLKRGREVSEADSKIRLLLEFADKENVPILEVPFEVSFRDIMSLIMEYLFNEEVTRLKFFKTTHDNFAALALSPESGQDSMNKILDVLMKLIGNPVALFNSNMACLAAAEGAPKKFELKKSAKTFDPGMFSNYRYVRQKMEDMIQYVVQMNLNMQEKYHLVITEQNQPFQVMDSIAVESAIDALRFEIARRHDVTELEKKFQNDILHNILNGKIHSVGELQKNAELLGVRIEGSYRVVVYGMESDSKRKSDFKAKMKDTDALRDIAAKIIPDVKIHNDLDKIVVIQEVSTEQTQESYRKEIREFTDKMQTEITKYNKHLRVKGGVGKVVEGIINLPDSYKEANEAFMFVDIAGEISEETNSQVTLFSDLGIFKLLCQLEDPAQLLEYVPESLQKLYNYKKPQREDLIATLKTYLDKNQNLSKTAQELYVHYKTAAYRVEKIAKITGIDFNNANEVLAIRIGLVVYTMIENYNRDFI